MALFLEKIIAHKVDANTLVLQCSESISRDLYEHYSYYVPGFKFMPKFRDGYWDGKIHLYSDANHTISVGLWGSLKAWCDENNYELEANFDLPTASITRNRVETFMADYLRPCDGGERITPHDFQITSVTKILNDRRLLLLSPTSSGKSLIIYALMRWWFDRNREDKTLIIVPTVQLVQQIFNEFVNYSSENKWQVANHVHKLYEGQAKTTDKAVLISTWQSLQNKPASYFKQFKHVIVDEAHTAKATTIKTILSSATNADYKVGLTGSLDGSEANEMLLNSLFGETYNLVTTKELMERGIVANLNIKILNLSYSDESREQMRTDPNNIFKAPIEYADEMNFLVGHKKRNTFLVKLGTSLKGNTLMLYQLVQKHGKPLYKLLKAAHGDRNVHFVSGGTDAEVREQLRKIVEQSDNAIILASYGTFSTGTSIKRINNIVFASPFKSQIKLLQSIGRGLRLSKTKTSVDLYDVTDDLRSSGPPKYTNFAYRHMLERVRIYKKQGFDFKTININLETPNG